MWDTIGNAAFTRCTSGAKHGMAFQRIDGRRGDGLANSGLNRWGIGVNSSVPMSGCVYLRGTVPGAVVALQGTRESRAAALHRLINVAHSQTVQLYRSERQLHALCRRKYIILSIFCTCFD